MSTSEQDKPLFGFLEDFHERTAQLEDEVVRLRRSLRFSEKHNSELRKKVEEAEKKALSQREVLVDWLDRRIKQQKAALTPSYLSSETKRMIKIEVSMLERYREIIVTSKHTSGSDDPLMPKFA